METKGLILMTLLRHIYAQTKLTKIMNESGGSNISDVVKCLLEKLQ